MKRFKKAIILLLAILPLIYTAITVLFFLPDTIAAHFGVDGRPDRYGSKYEAFILPGACLILYLCYLLGKKLALRSSKDDEKRAERNRSVLDTMFLILFVLLNAVCIYILMLMGDPSLALNNDNLINAIIPTFIGILFIILGNIMPKTKRNSYIGVRLPFAMDTDEHWYIANRAGGIALVISGIATVIAGLILRNITYLVVMAAALLITLVVAIIYSYVKIKRNPKE